MKIFAYVLEVLIISTLGFSEYFCLPRSIHDEFPEGFSFGVGSNAYHIEGAWNEDGRGPSVLDTFSHNFPEKIVDMSNADVSDDCYHFYREDVRAIESIAMNHYFFSFSWSRILPNGSFASLNMAAIEYYNDLIDEIIRNRIEPIGTMTRLDLPQAIQNLGGYMNSVVVEYFKVYADVLFHYFGDRVKRWITFDEPFVICSIFNGNGYLAPTIPLVAGRGQYLCGHNVLKAHATVYGLYQKYYAKRCKGKVGISLYTGYYISKRGDYKETKRALEFELGWFAHPIFSREGNYPTIMRKQIAELSRREGNHRSRLPVFSKRWIKKIRGSADFMGLTYFTTNLIEPIKSPLPYYEFNFHSNDALFNYTVRPEWVQSTTSYVYFTPQGLGKVLPYIRDEYDNPDVLITRTGWSDHGELNDHVRIKYLRSYLKEALDSINAGCNLVGFTVWSLLNSYEYRNGYTTPFGLFAVNFTNSCRELTPKASADFMRQVSLTRRIPGF